MIVYTFFAPMCVCKIYCRYVLWKSRLLFHMKCRSCAAKSVYLILFYAMEYSQAVAFVFLIISSTTEEKNKIMVTIALTAKFRSICHLNKRNSLYMSGWSVFDVFDIKNLWNSSEAAFIGPLIYAELKARDVVHKIDSSFLIKISSWKIYERMLHKLESCDGGWQKNNANNYWLLVP